MPCRFGFQRDQSVHLRQIVRNQIIGNLTNNTMTHLAGGKGLGKKTPDQFSFILSAVPQEK